MRRPPAAPPYVVEAVKLWAWTAEQAPTLCELFEAIDSERARLADAITVDNFHHIEHPYTQAHANLTALAEEIAGALCPPLAEVTYIEQTGDRLRVLTTDGRVWNLTGPVMRRFAARFRAAQERPPAAGVCGNWTPAKWREANA